jgi:hypothetical protein
MPAQGVTLVVNDGGLGQSPPGLGNVEVVIGVCSGGSTEPSLYYAPIQTANPSTITSTCGYGPGPEMTCNIIQAAGNPVIYIPIPYTTPGQNTGPFAATGNIGTAPLTLSGAPVDSYYGTVECTTACTIGSTAGQVTVSLDFQRTTFATINIPASYVAGTPLSVTQGGIATGLSISFGNGSLAQGDTFYWISDEPMWSDAAVASAIQALYNWNQSNPEDIVVVGGSARRNGAGTVGSQASDVVSFDSQMTALFNKTRYMRLLCSAGDAQWGGASTESESTWENSLANAFANSSSLRVGVTGGHYNCVSAISQTQFRRPLLWFAAARDSAVAIQVDLGRVKDGALGNLVLPTTPDTGFAGSTKPFVYHDETVNPGLDGARLMSAWSIARRPGLFIKNPNLLAPPGSDFNWLQHGHIIDGACLIVYDFFVNELSDNVLVYPAGSQNAGQLLTSVSNYLISSCNSLLYTGLVAPGAASAAVVTIPAGQNILTTAALYVNSAITPPGYLKAIVVTLQFQNPGVVQVSSP